MENPFGSGGQVIKSPFEEKKEKVKTEPVDLENSKRTETSDFKPSLPESSKEAVEEALDKSVEHKVTVVKTTKSAKQAILDQYGGIESNVPINSAYWNLKN